MAQVDLTKLESLVANIAPGTPFDPAPLQAEIAAIKAQQSTDEGDIASLNTAFTDALTKLQATPPDVAGAVSTLQAATGSGSSN